MAISSLSSYSNFGSFPAELTSSKTSTSLFHASLEKAFIDITTSEGDTVSFQRSTSHMAQTNYTNWQTSSAQATSIQSQTLDSHSFSYMVQGDLSAEELEDIGKLFHELSAIAEDFYQGDLEQALTGALQIGDLGSLSSLSATFTKAEVMASKTSSQQQYGLAHAPETERSKEEALARQRQAQWQQILNYLDKKKQEMAELGKKRSGANQEPWSGNAKNHRQSP